MPGPRAASHGPPWPPPPPPSSARAGSGLGLRSVPPGWTKRGRCAARADRSHQPAGRDNCHCHCHRRRHRPPPPSRLLLRGKRQGRGGGAARGGPPRAASGQVRAGALCWPGGVTAATLRQGSELGGVGKTQW